MKAERRKHKVGKARSITAKAGKKLEESAGGEPEPNDVVQAIEPQKKKPKLQPPSSPGKRNRSPVEREPDHQLDKDTQGLRSESTETLAVGKTNPKSKPTERRKKRKEVTIYFVSVIVGATSF